VARRHAGASRARRGRAAAAEHVADHHGFELRPELPFPLSAPWFWEGDEDSDPDDERFDTTRHGWLPLRHYGCGEYDVIVVTGTQAGHVWTLTDVGIACFEGEPRGAQLGRDRRRHPPGARRRPTTRSCTCSRSTGRAPSARRSGGRAGEGGVGQRVELQAAVKDLGALLEVGLA
jgi:hypothetical protein